MVPAGPHGWLRQGQRLRKGAGGPCRPEASELRRRISEFAPYGRFIAEAAACTALFCRKDALCELEELLQCPESHELVTMFPLGYPAEDKRRPEKTLDEVLRREMF